MANEKVDKYFLAAIVESSQDSIISVDSDMLITSWNKAAEGIYGYAADEVMGEPLTRLTRDQDLKMITAKVKQVIDGKVVKVFGTERIGKGNETLHLEILMSPVRDAGGEIIGASTIARDVSVSRKAERAFRDREVMAKVLTAHEEERARLARDLHDQLGQEVTALRFMLKSAKDACEDERFLEEMVGMESTIEAIDRNIDFIAWDLRPAGLASDSSLSAAINNFMRQWSRHTGIAIKPLPRAPAADRLLSHVDTNFYRIVQEALNNIRKHANATEVELTLKTLKGSVRLIIADNGKGFNTKGRKKKRAGFGLVGMRERAALIGADFEIESAPGHGTTIYVTVPTSPIYPDETTAKGDTAT
jgi:PAS domain S-box-containing protein